MNSPKHLAPEAVEPGARTRKLRTPLFWAAPILVVALLMSLLAALYLGGILDPKGSLHGFPIAVVNQDEGDVPPGSDARQNIGEQIVAGLTDGIPADKVDLRQVGIGTAQSMLDSAEVYGAIVIPSDFTKRMMILAQSSVVPGDVERPIITVYTNPRAGTFGVGIVEAITGPAMETVNETVGRQVTEQVAAGVGDTPVPGASRLTLAEPINVLTVPHKPLPDGTGNGLSAFYYALLVILAGFTGAMIVNTLIDGMLGFAPTEFGPRYLHNPAVEISRLQTLAVKWAVMLVVAPLVSGLYVWISHLLSMPLQNALGLWLYGTFAIAAVGITAMSVLAIFGTAGMIINLIIFVVLGLPSAGGTIPIEATPPFFGWLASFEPMHQVFLGVRALLYFGEGGARELTHAVTMTAIGLAVGLVIGAVTAALYDRKGFHRGVATTPA
ncbi:YhgE/Pip domain-containing protein [Rhodococcus sp. NPDC058505]|uniref:YhgE/Pip domain-containing protein n=1 Tax=unclassified Rhodococcus (in: high G+C Gram-positive bacteria) TaxID=192944 RepID=UPI003646D250